jgi:hypothetical protein
MKNQSEGEGERRNNKSQNCKTEVKDKYTGRPINK